jgi:leucyl aminopeptidase
MPSIRPLTSPPRITLHSASDAGALLGPKSDRDAVVVLTPLQPPIGLLDHPRLAKVKRLIARLAVADPALVDGEPAVTLLPTERMPGGRLVVASTGRLDRYTDDVRAFAEAGAAGLKRAWKAGVQKPALLVLTPDDDPRYARAVEVGVLGALSSLWRSVEARVARFGKAPQVKNIGVIVNDAAAYAELPVLVRALEQGRGVARDITGTEPEVMTPEAVADYVEQTFAKGPVQASVERDPEAIRAAYPLLWNVARGSLKVERYLPRVIRLEYDPGEKVERTVLLVGKGVTYDTGGHNIKTGAFMSGMSRDKGGAGAVAGVMRVVQELRPAGVRVVALMGMVRNSVSSEAYVTDEVLTSRAGVRVRVGNTDAEGRLVLADLLAEAAEVSRRAPGPVIATVATLTGHAARAVGPYPVSVENGPARAGRFGDLIEAAGETWGEPLERSRVRREDYSHVKGKTDAEDVISIHADLTPSASRGHQFPLAFLDLSSGLGKRGKKEIAPPPLVHVDIAGSAVAGGDYAYGVPTGSPVLPLYLGLVQGPARG